MNRNSYDIVGEPTKVVKDSPEPIGSDSRPPRTPEELAQVERDLRNCTAWEKEITWADESAAMDRAKKELKFRYCPWAF